MYAKHLIDKVLITLEVGNQTALFILLEKAGVIHRKGNGSPHATELTLKEGVSQQGHFEALMMTVNENLFNYTGVINMPGRQGTECRLTLIFQGPEGIDYSFRVIYGAESEGPPQELAEILINAVKITDQWYQDNVAANEPGRKWWKPW